ncbi:2OG-Fe(II) oxygenase [Sphingomonas naphthae]|uniref:2OG-Fe(II) oxygenase n=1 Tax=Sphingomonas naphthae TaxID=1813468 RepID=A0ABY7TGT2_9SPHN|nr:2OG-Fe(II) oxygenase [Sphingomonas naphthae]WCT72436.1 2OG-Fe(II) oxygenase [Sphingomonas naphthae]
MRDAQALAAAGRVEEAVALLRAGAGRGEVDALLMLAAWHVLGCGVARDMAAARDLYGRAAEAGSAAGAQLYLACLVTGSGGPVDWLAAMDLLRARAAEDADAAHQLALLGPMALGEGGAPAMLPPAEALSDTPWVRIVRGAASPAECDYVAALAAPRLAPSMVIDPRTRQSMRHPVRNSDAANFPVLAENAVIRALNLRIAALTGTDVAQGEPLQILRYANGQEYRPHGDYLPGEANQRILTAILYLTDGYAGGETRFTATGLAVSGGKGDLLIFRNTDADGTPDRLSAHAGQPVTAGVKMIATRWIRAAPLPAAM